MLSTFEQRLEAAGHKLVRDADGSVDCWMLDHDYHNGPGCELCGESWCHHCENRVIEPCTHSRVEQSGSSQDS